MANEEHLAILREALDEKDIEIWNLWRRANPDIRPDLSEIDLVRANLAQANLYEANLRDSELYGANLSEANLCLSSLGGTNLWEADLRRAHLNGSSLYLAHLWEANLQGADLRGADLRRANLLDTNFENAQCAYTAFADIDLSKALNLDKVVHLEPSTIGIDTLYKSKGKIPEVFLRGCGVPDTFIEIMHVLFPDAATRA